MAVLALDTSSGIAVSILDLSPSGTLTELATERRDEGRKHAELLTPLIELAFAAAGVTPQDVTHVVVGTGPAPFTGLRAGLVTARTFAFARNVPIFGVSSLDAIAQSAAGRLGLGHGQRVVALADARRKEVYWATYVVGEQGLQPETPPDVASPTALVTAGDLSVSDSVTDTIVVSAGQIGVVQEAGIFVADDESYTHPTVLAEIAFERHRNGETLPTEPLYLRRPDVQVPGPLKKAL